eukprot:83761-Chlamydomonas_euryale.AAC.1
MSWKAVRALCVSLGSPHLVKLDAGDLAGGRRSVRLRARARVPHTDVGPVVDAGDLAGRNERLGRVLPAIEVNCRRAQRERRDVVIVAEEEVLMVHRRALVHHANAS